MGKRHPGHKFMPGKFVFPGGRIEPGDRRMAAAGALRRQIARQRCCARHASARTAQARALALAAIRETFEETGLLLRHGRATARPRRPPPGSWERVSRATASSRSRSRAFRRPRHHAAAPAEALRHALLRGRPHGDRAERIEGVVGPDAELVELVWVDLDEAAAARPAADHRSIMLDELEAPDRRRASRHYLPVPFYCEKQRQLRARGTLTAGLGTTAARVAPF